MEAQQNNSSKAIIPLLKFSLVVASLTPYAVIAFLAIPELGFGPFSYLLGAFEGVFIGVWFYALKIRIKKQAGTPPLSQYPFDLILVFSKPVFWTGFFIQFVSPIAYPIINLTLGRGNASIFAIFFAPVIWLSLPVQAIIYVTARKLLKKNIASDKQGNLAY